MFYMVSHTRRPATTKLMALVIVVAIVGLVGHAVLDAFPAWPAAVVQTSEYETLPTGSGQDRLVLCAVHTSCIAALPASVVQLTLLIFTIPVTTVLFSQPALPPPTAPPK